MVNRFFPSLMLVGFGLTAASSGQQLQVGHLPGSSNYVMPPAPVTLVDINAPSPATGTLTSATFAFSSFPCPAAVKIKTFSRPYISGLRCCPGMSFLGERGPFDVTQGTQTVSLTPPLPIVQGGFVGISSLSSCGNPLGAAGGTDRIAVYSSDVTSDVGLPLVPTDFLPHIDNVTLSLAGFGTQRFFMEVSGTVPVIFTGDGAASSHFRTEALFFNPTVYPISGSLRFVPAYQTSPPTLIPYSLNSLEVQHVDLRGFGSVDILPATGSGAAALVRVFNDLGSAGTVGFTETEIPPTEALVPGEWGLLIGPTDSTNFRLNIGLRALDTQAFLAIRANGALTYVAPEFGLSQRSFNDLLGIPLEPNVRITFEVLSGSAIVYGVTADNRSNDISFQLARHIRVVPPSAVSAARSDRTFTERNSREAPGKNSGQ